MASIGKIARRTFLFGAAAVAGGVAFGYYQYSRPFDNPLEGELGDGEATFNPYVKIAADNAITIIAPRAEMGQGIMTTLAALVAEELDVTLDQVTIEHGPASAAYYNRAALQENAPFPRFDESFAARNVRHALGVVAKFAAIQLTGGSTSTIDGYEKMRAAGATAREMLKAAAASRLGVPAQSLSTAAGIITDPKSGKTLTYGEVAADAARLEPPGDVRLRDKSEWKILGRSQPRKDMLAKIAGQPVFGIDVQEEDMLYATIRMNPHPGGKLATVDLGAAKAMRGVIKAVRIDSPFGQGIGVIADNSWRAFQAADAIAATARWEKGPSPDSSAAIEAALDQRLAGEAGFTLRSLGDVDLVFADAPREAIVEAEYYAPYLSHAAMEPMNATARLRNGVLDIWAGHQAPTIARDIGMALTGLGGDKVRIHITMMGGGFGRRTEPDFIDYAVRLAMEADGRPVKVTWTREEDMTLSPLRPVAKARYRAVLGKDGMPRALGAIVASPSPSRSLIGRIYPSLPMAGPDPTIIDGAWNQPYAIENYRIEGRVADIAIPTTFWRSVGNSFNAFMHESFIDEIAAAGKIDPLELRRKLMAPWPVALGVINRVAEMSGWDAKLPAGRGRGLAFTLSFGTWVAQVVEVSETDGAIRVENVWCAADAGLVLDERNVKAQMMSGIIFGLSAAMGQQITFADGRVEQRNFADHDGLRLHQCPAIEIDLVANASGMGGAGEPGTPPVMAALSNAIFALNGKRLRRMPFSSEVAFA